MPPQKSLALAAYPQATRGRIDLKSETQMAILQDLIVSVRNLRAELKVEPRPKVPSRWYPFEPEIRALIEQNQGAVERLARSTRSRLPRVRLASFPARGTPHDWTFQVV